MKKLAPWIAFLLLEFGLVLAGYLLWISRKGGSQDVATMVYFFACVMFLTAAWLASYVVLRFLKPMLPRDESATQQRASEGW